MNVYISKNAELFFKALEDVWAAGMLWYGSPNLAVWHCTQAVEKTMKGYLRVINVEFDHGHSLMALLVDVLADFALSEEAEEQITYMGGFTTRLRYRNMADDPTPEEVKIAISRTKQIMQEFNSHPKVSQFMDEAREVHTKILKANSAKYSDSSDAETPD